MENCIYCGETIEGSAEQIRDSGWIRVNDDWVCQDCADNLPQAQSVPLEN